MPPAFSRFPRLFVCLSAICLLSLSRGADERPLAFEGAEGFGAYARGGAGGRTLFVTTRNDTGREGSLRWALAQKGPRIVLFKVGGIFELDSNLKVKEPFLTLDGSTAPDGGVTLKDSALEFLGTHDIIVRYLRVRPGDEAALGQGRWAGHPRPVKASDAVTVKDSHDVIVDHVSGSWSTDETISVTHSRRVTVQHCIIAEPLANPKLHIEDGVEIPHAYGALVEGDEVCYLKNYFAYFKIRGPQLASPSEGESTKTAAVNNLVAFYENSGTRVKASHITADFVVLNNVYRHPLSPGAPDIHLLLEKIKADHRRRSEASTTVGHTHVYIAGNLGPLRPSAGLDEWAGVRADFSADVVKQLRVTQAPFEVQPFKLLATEAVEADVLANAGATLPARDPIDERILRQYREARGTVIKRQAEVGGYDVLVAPAK
jgi:hypothetical protein